MFLSTLIEFKSLSKIISPMSEEIIWIVDVNEFCVFTYNLNKETNSKYSFSIINSLTEKSINSSNKFL